MWECQKCSERHEDTFDVCWNCGTSKDGTDDAAFRRADDPAASLPAEQDLPPAPAGGSVCPKCGSPDLIPHVRLVDRDRYNSRAHLQVEVYEKPDALLFRGPHRGTLTASVCGRCGYAEIYVGNVQELLAAYRQSLAKRMELF